MSDDNDQFTLAQAADLIHETVLRTAAGAEELLHLASVGYLEIHPIHRVILEYVATFTEEHDEPLVDTPSRYGEPNPIRLVTPIPPEVWMPPPGSDRSR
jgi:hypothetical protein